MVARGCGTRKEGGLYAETKLSPNGVPLEEFLMDPPVPTVGLDLASIGTHLIERNGVWHIADVVGREHYPNVADFIEEVRRFGASRKLNPQMGLEKLTAESRLLLAHDRAWIDNWQEWSDWNCPKGNPYHRRIVMEDAGPDCKPCLGLVWEDVEEGNAIESALPATIDRWVDREMPAFYYVARCRPEGVTPVYKQSFFLSLPISNLAVIAAQDGSHQALLERVIEQCQLPVFEEEE